MPPLTLKGKESLSGIRHFHCCQKFFYLPLFYLSLSDPSLSSPRRNLFISFFSFFGSVRTLAGDPEKRIPVEVRNINGINNDSVLMGSQNCLVSLSIEHPKTGVRTLCCNICRAVSIPSSRCDVMSRFL